MASTHNETETEQGEEEEEEEEEEVVDEIDWEDEARAIIDDVKFAVQGIHQSRILSGDDTSSAVYLNIETKEGKRLCVELSACGFRVVGEEFDSFDKHRLCQKIYFETVYALLDTYSPCYRDSFGQELTTKLSELDTSECNMEESPE